MRTEFNSRETSAKMESDERKALSRRVASEVDESSRSSSSYYKSNASHLSGTAGEQVVIKREQEVVLGKLDAGLSTLKEMARTIDDELEGQNKLLESIDNETDKAQGSMDQAIKSIEKLLGTSNSCQLCTILSLVVVFVIGECPPFHSPSLHFSCCAHSLTLLTLLTLAHWPHLSFLPSPFPYKCSYCRCIYALVLINKNK